MISGPTSYIPTIDEFLAHWAAVNADPLAGTGLVTRDGKTRANLASVQTELLGASTDVQNNLNGKEIARARVENGKSALLDRSRELVRRLRGILPEKSPYLKALPEMPIQSSAQETFLQPVRDLVNLWNRLDAEGTHFTLADAYAHTGYEAELGALVTLYTTLTTALLDLKLAREKRNKLQNDARAILSAYRPAVEGFFPPDSPLVNTIPLLTPKPGHTPAAVTATAAYDPAAQEAVVKFTASAEAELESYQLRGVPGPDYAGDDEVILATIPKGAPREFRTAFSLTEPGASASFKVFVILTTGNEAGSVPVMVARPV